MDTFFDPSGFMSGMLAVAVIVPLATTLLIVGVIVWAIRRNGPARDDPAVAELKGRLARGEIDPVEYEVRIRALRDGDR